jgi:S1-C subfamily serine protease
MMVADTKIGEKVRIVVLRKGETKTLYASLKEYPQKELVTPISVPVSAHWLGIKVKKKGNEGLIVVDIEEYSPGYRSKLMKGDVILEVNGEIVKDWKDYKEIAKKLKDEKQVMFYVKRGKKNLYVGIRNY